MTPGSYLNQSLEVITSGFRAGKIDGAVIWEPTASRLVGERLARRVASGNDFDEPDGAFLDIRADLVKQRPDVVKGWLQAELDAEQFLADPKNAHQVVKLLKAQTTGFSEEELYKALFGFYSKETAAVRRFASPCPSPSRPRRSTLIKKDTAFLYAIKSISTPRLADDAVLTDVTAAILKERNLKIPVGRGESRDPKRPRNKTLTEACRLEAGEVAALVAAALPLKGLAAATLELAGRHRRGYVVSRG